MERCYSVIGYDRNGRGHVLRPQVDAADANAIANSLWRAANQQAPGSVPEHLPDGTVCTLALAQIVSIKVVPIARGAQPSN